jgi:flagellar hook-length control protein FliK
MASNLTVSASTQTNRSTPSVTMGGDMAAQPFAKVLEREVNTRQEGQPDSANQKSSASLKDEHEAGAEEQSAVASAQEIQPWFAMLQAQAVFAQVTPVVAEVKTDASADVRVDVATLGLSKMDKGLLEDGEAKDSKDLSELEQLGLKLENKKSENLTDLEPLSLKPESALLNGLNVGKHISSWEKTARVGEFTPITSDVSSQFANSSAQAALPWLTLLPAQVGLAQATPLVADINRDARADVTVLDLSKMAKGLLGDGEGKDGKDLSDLEQLGLTPEGGVDTAKLASLRQKVVGAGEFTASTDGFSALLASSKENVLLPKIEAAPQITLPTPVVEAKPALPQHTVAEPVGSPRWGDAVAQRVSMMLQDQHQQIDMQLNPPHLGPMEVRLTMSGEQASVVFSSQHASVREALAAATPRLTMLLADQGIQLSNVQVASDSLNQHAQQQAQQQASSQQMNQQRQSRAQQFVGNLNGAYADGQPRVMTDVHLPVARSGLNLYV